MSLLIVDFSV